LLTSSMCRCASRHGDTAQAPAGGPRPCAHARPRHCRSSPRTASPCESPRMAASALSQNLRCTASQKGNLQLARQQRPVRQLKERELRRWMGTARFSPRTCRPPEDLRSARPAAAWKYSSLRPTQPRSVLKPTGQALELAPVTHPNDFRREAAEFVLLAHGSRRRRGYAGGFPAAIAYRDDSWRDKAKTAADCKSASTWPKPACTGWKPKLVTDQAEQAGH